MRAFSRSGWWASVLALVLAWLVPAMSVHAQQSRGDADGSVLVLGRVSDDPKAHYDQLKPLLDYVVPRMANVGIRSGRILMARDLAQMTSYLHRGRVDWVTETAGNGALLEKRGGARAMLLAERRGVSRYRTLFFVRKDSGIKSLQDLTGRSVAFQNPYSTSAYYLPASELLRKGLKLELVLSPMDQVPPDAVGYLFARTELNIATWVHKGLADAGVVSNVDWQDPRRTPPAFLADFHVVAQTEDVPRALELVRTDLDARVQERLREVLLEAAADPEAGEALRRYMGTTRFLPVDGQTRRALDDLSTGVLRVRREVE